MLFSRINFFFGPFQSRLDTASERREAIALVKPNVDLLTTNDLVPHLSRRRKIGLTNWESLQEIDTYQMILIDKVHPGWDSSPKLVKEMNDRLMNDRNWTTTFKGEAVVLYEKLTTSASE